MLTRRTFLTAFSALTISGPALALTTNEAEALVGKVTREINTVINSGKSVNGMIRDFEGIFARYADVFTIARSTLGGTARSTSQAQLNAYSKAFQGYMARKYGKQFREFQGGTIEVQKAKVNGRIYEVNAVVKRSSGRPLQVIFRVSDRSGSDKFFDIIIEGVSLLSAERAEIAALLDRRGGDVARLTRDLASMG